MNMSLKDTTIVILDMMIQMATKLHLVGHKIRTAKKDYKCNRCHAKIAANTKYMDFATKYMRTRFCIDCGKVTIGED